jgi:hydroxymethylpyrimidine kinase / phosphomethylpyrimidine kinase / thiamine-phosphate diphosphorylase
VQEMVEAAKELAELGPEAVLVKGGHLPAGGGENVGTVVDVLYERTTGEAAELRLPRVVTSNTHGTGCTLASAVAAHLAQGASTRGAVQAAQGYVAACLAQSAALSLGSGPQGAMDHGAGLCSVAGAPARAVAPLHRQPLDLSVYAVTDSGMNATHTRSTADAVAAAVSGGATVIQVRCAFPSGTTARSASMHGVPTACSAARAGRRTSRGGAFSSASRAQSLRRGLTAFQ